MKQRNIFGPGREELKNLLTTRAKMAVDIVVYDHHVRETELFGHQLTQLFTDAEWKCRQWVARRAKSRVSGASTLIAIADGYVDRPLIEFAEKLRSALVALEVECDISLGRFGCKGEFEPGDFELISEKPLQIFGNKGVCPFRIQIGALQLVPVPPTKILFLAPGPVTPPQA
jgi:hypothetical protein